MNQPVHILKKDALHLWPEILVSLCLLGALVWATPHTHGTPDPELPWLYPLLSAFIKFLIPITWLVLISRLVHDETLVGDRQFWITRPYTWYGLLGAKLLFLAAFLYLPLLLAQSWLLHHAGLHPLGLAVPFLKNFGGITAVIILPLFALAAVTSTFVRFALSVLAAIVYLIAIIALMAFTIPDKLAVNSMGYVYTALMVIVPIIALVLQYARRRTGQARTLLIALPAALYLLAAITPANTLVGRDYRSALPFNASLNPSTDFQQSDSGKVFVFKSKVHVLLPVMVSNLTAPTSLRSEHQIVRLDGPGGFHYETGWTTIGNALQPGVVPSRLFIELPEDVYKRIENVPVALHVTLGVERFEPETTYDVTATEAAFPIPSRGACKASSTDGQLLCNFPFANPDGMAVEADATSGTCANPGPTAPAVGSLSVSPEVPALDPVSSQEALFQPMTHSAGTLICPGSRLHLARLKSTAKGSVALDVPSIVLGPYAIRQGGGHPPQR